MNTRTVCAIRLGVVFLAALVSANSAWGRAMREEPAAGSAGEKVASSDWRLSLRPYLFFSGVSGSVTAEPLTFPINSSFGELLDNLELGGFVTFTAEKGRWGGYADFQYIGLKGTGTSALDAVVELDNLIVEGDLTFRPAGTPTLVFLVGMRVYSLDQAVSIRGQLLPNANTAVFDPIVGALGQWALSQRWDFEIRGDIGGFGASSEFTYQLMLLFHGGLSRNIGLPFGYRVLGYQIKTEGIWMNTRMGGLVLGLDVRF